MSDDDLSDDLQHIMDDLDDDLFGKKKKPGLDDPLERRKPTSSPPKGNGKKVKFEDNEKDEGAGKTSNKRLDLDDKSNIMDDLFGSSKKENKSSFLDDILGDNSSQKKEPVEKKDFVLDDKYKKPIISFRAGHDGSPGQENHQRTEHRRVQQTGVPRPQRENLSGRGLPQQVDCRHSAQGFLQAH